MSSPANEAPDQPAKTKKGIDTSDQYREVMLNLRLGVTLLWEAFKTYFAISTILFTAFAFLNTPAKKQATSLLSSDGRLALSVGIAVIGILISALGWFATRRFLEYQKSYLDYGVSLEGEDGLISHSKSTWSSAKLGAPGYSVVIFAAFGSLWILMLIAIYNRCLYPIDTQYCR